MLALRATAAVRSVAVDHVRLPASERFRRAGAQLVFHIRRTGRVPGGRQSDVRGHAPPGVDGHPVVRRTARRQPDNNRLQLVPQSVPQPSGLADIRFRAAVGHGGPHDVQLYGIGPARSHKERARRTRRDGVQLRLRVPRNPVLSVRPLPYKLVGVPVLRGCVRVERRFRRVGVFRTQIKASHRQGICYRAFCLTFFYVYIYIYIYRGTPQSYSYVWFNRL